MLSRVALVRTDVSFLSYFVPSSPILVTLMMEALRSSETPVITKATQRNISIDAILQDLVMSLFSTDLKPASNLSHHHSVGKYI
jgi:hypothetical protein